MRRKRLLGVGGLNYDTVHLHPEIDGLSDGKATPEQSYTEIGGGGPNLVIAGREISEMRGEPIDITLVTKKGTPPLHQEFVSKARLADLPAIVAAIMRNEVEFDLHGIDVIDTVKGQENTIPHNLVISPRTGRFINVMNPNQRIYCFEAETEAQMIRRARSADMVFGHTTLPLHSGIVFGAAHRNGVPTFLDYSVTKWKEPEKILNYQLLSHATYVVMAADATLDNMPRYNPKGDNTERTRLLIRRVMDEFGVRNIAVSDGAKPVIVIENGKEYEIEVEAVETGFMLGVGDTRNIGAILALLDDLSFVESITLGSELATFSAKYPGRTWLEHAPAFLMWSLRR